MSSLCTAGCSAKADKGRVTLSSQTARKRKASLESWRGWMGIDITGAGQLEKKLLAAKTPPISLKTKTQSAFDWGGLQAVQLDKGLGFPAGHLGTEMGIWHQAA